ncbi:MAG: alpha/beta fold hydrolase [Thermomicrobiales bacterium]|nr:alpha/beta fold hydrolase [Thermomicrobiales bacterium]MCO5220318.1 alpha/beta fold hydrolase [Thermomicrobiales bacterium]
MKARIRGTEIWFDVDGAGLVPDGPRMVEKPVAFVLHGGPGGDHSYYKPALDPLTDKMQLVYIDHRGQGRSGRGDRSTYTLENNVEDLEALRDYLGLDKIVLLGASYGGMVALSYAVRYPQNVSHLIALVTSAHAGTLERAKEILAERGTEEQKRVCEALWDGNFQTEEELIHYFDVMEPMYSYSWKPDMPKDGLERGIYSIDAINEGFSGFLRTYDLRDQLHKITCPTLVVGARHDWICAPEFSEEIASLIPHADLRIFERSGHEVIYDEQNELFDVVRGFMTYNG